MRGNVCTRPTPAEMQKMQESEFWKHVNSASCSVYANPNPINLAKLLRAAVPSASGADARSPTHTIHASLVNHVHSPSPISLAALNPALQKKSLARNQREAATYHSPLLIPGIHIPRQRQYTRNRARSSIPTHLIRMIKHINQLNTPLGSHIERRRGEEGEDLAQ